ncbi:MAG: NGG1p interacting factor NIF3 [Candidatus Kerfeldbacteria bacterium]|nr:NGG1p interacting factor NIF3 [Candidatus Kerfeldbacteria bacterium]
MALTVGQIYKLAVELGIKNDLRGVAAVKRHLKRMAERFAKLEPDEKKEFDREDLWNPYADTRVYVGNLNKIVKRAAMGIDVETPEILLAYEIAKKKPIDLIITHHPVSTALAGLHEVMHMQAEVLAKYGVPINVAQGLLHVRIDEVSRKLSPINHQRDVDAARLLDLAFMSAHTTSDNLVASFLDKLVKRNQKKLELVGDVLKLLKTIPEYRQATKWKAGPRLFAGRPDRFAGKIALTELTGGTEGAPEIYHRLAQAGIGTVIGMHMSEKHKEEAEKAHVNAIIAGHMSSDSIGMNLFADQLEGRGVEIVPFGGFIRVKRRRR